MIKKTNIDLSINPKRKNPLTVGVQLSSYDKNFHEFEISFLEKELEEGDTVNILTVFESSKRDSKTTTEIRGGYALFSFDTSLIDRDEVVTNYVYLKSGDSQAEIGAFKFDVKLSEIDNEARVIAKAYDESYESLIQDFEKELRSYLPKLETMNQEEGIRQDEEEVRKLAEADRVTSEEIRESAESVRVSNEEERELSEAERITKDSERDSKIEAIGASKLDKKDMEWITPTLINGWSGSNYWGGIRYGKDTLNFVHIQGVVNNGEASVIFQLPPEFRPDKARVFFMVYSGGQVGEILEGEVRQDGVVLVPSFAGKGQLKFQILFFAREAN